jgi:AraC family transcriptional activator of pobA
MNKQNIPLYDFRKDDASSVQFRMEKLEHLNEYNPGEPHRHNYYEIFFFNKGGGHHMIDFENIPVSDNSLHFVSPGQIHQVRRALRSEGVVIMFSRDFYYTNLENKEVLFEMPFLNNRYDKPVIELKNGQLENIKQLMQSIQGEFCTEGDLTSEILRSYLDILLLKCKSYFEQANDNIRLQPKAGGGQLVSNFKTLIEKNFRELHQVHDYAELLSVTTNHLNDITKKALGKTASDIIHDRIILESKRLLAHSDLSSKEISFQLNYEDPSYFSRFFTKNTGMSPNAFRKQHREKYSS